VHAKISEAELIIAGKGDCYEELLRLKEELNLNSVRFCGRLNEKQKMQILQSGWVYVIPSMKEGWGISTLEANACGTPAIAYDVSGLRDSIKHGKTGLLVESGNIKALSEAIITILEDEELREKLSENALEYSKQFSWDKSAVQVLNELGGLMK
jgi:glycosyltransferase involved in cell wall biosynthesis